MKTQGRQKDACGSRASRFWRSINGQGALRCSVDTGGVETDRELTEKCFFESSDKNEEAHKLRVVAATRRQYQAAAAAAKLLKRTRAEMLKVERAAAGCLTGSPVDDNLNPKWSAGSPLRVRCASSALRRSSTLCPPRRLVSPPLHLAALLEKIHLPPARHHAVVQVPRSARR